MNPLFSPLISVKNSGKDSVNEYRSSFLTIGRMCFTEGIAIFSPDMKGMDLGEGVPHIFWLVSSTAAGHLLSSNEGICQFFSSSA